MALVTPRAGNTGGKLTLRSVQGVALKAAPESRSDRSEAERVAGQTTRYHLARSVGQLSRSGQAASPAEPTGRVSSLASIFWIRSEGFNCCGYFFPIVPGQCQNLNALGSKLRTLVFMCIN